VSIDPFHRRVSLLGLALLGLAGGCSLAVDERVTPLDQGAIPDDLTEATTTTTTTTLPPTTTAPPDTGVGSTEPTTTTQPAIPTETITVYYTRGVTDVMQQVEVARAIGTPVAELVALLERPTGISEAGLRTSVLGGMIDDIFVERGTATVLLDQDILDRMSNANQQRAIAQIVLTLTSFVTTDAGAIGFVRFEVDGEGFSVFVPGFGGTSEPGESLAFTDFSVLIATTPTPTTTTTTTTTTTPAVATTEPPVNADEDQ
jgi:hypothetical protein